MKKRVLPISIIMIVFTLITSSKSFIVEELLNKESIDNVILSMKFQNGDVEDNLYSSSISYIDISTHNRLYVENPLIRAALTYRSLEYRLSNCKIVSTTTRPDGLARSNYVATFIRLNDIPEIDTVGYYNFGSLSSVFREYQINNSFTLDIAIETSVGAQAEAFGFGAAAGIKTSLNESAVHGSGNSFTVQYDFMSDAITIGKKYSIVRTKSSYELITILYLTRYHGNKNSYYWDDYERYAYITNAICITDFSLAES